MANEIYQVRGTPIVWKISAGDEELDIDGLTADGVKAGSYYDRTASAAPDEYEWEAIIDGFSTPPVVGETVDLYFAQGGTTGTFDGQIIDLVSDTTGCVPTEAMLKNMTFAGSTIVHSTTAADEIISRGVVRFTSRYIMPVVHNNTTDDALATGTHILNLTPVYYQAQS